jgi:hypothetical protein
MAGTIRSRAYLDTAYADSTSGDISAEDGRDFVYSVHDAQCHAGGRLTLTTAVPVTSADVTGAGTLYYTPYLHNKIGLYDGTSWTLHEFTERSLALTLTAAKNYDVFLCDNAGTLTLELSAAWTNDTTRADALAVQDGVIVKSGATTRRWLGTIRSSGTNTTEDSLAKRFVCNAYNRVPRALRRIDTTTSWTYTTDTWRQARADTANQVEVVCGTADVLVDLYLAARCSNSGTTASLMGAIGLDSTSAPASASVISRVGTLVATATVVLPAAFRGYPGLGYHALVWLERSTANDTTTWSGENTTLVRTGLHGWVEM